MLTSKKINEIKGISDIQGVLQELKEIPAYTDTAEKILHVIENHQPLPKLYEGDPGNDLLEDLVAIHSPVDVWMGVLSQKIGDVYNGEEA